MALGALFGKSEYGLEVLRDVTPADVQQGRRYMEETPIEIGLKQGGCDILYIEVEVAAGSDRRWPLSRKVIRDLHGLNATERCCWRSVPEPVHRVPGRVVL